jgi:hypothetical protein
VLYLHEVHRVVGAHEHEFEAAFRDQFMPALAEGDDARLLWFMHHAHGTGRAYQAVTVTGVRDGAAWESLVKRIQSGDLQKWAAEVDQYRHCVTGKILIPVPWSPLTELDLSAVPVEDARHPLTLYMEDTAWPHEAMLDDYLEAARDHYAPSLTDAAQARGFLDLQAVFQTAWGAGPRREVVLWQKIKDVTRVTPLITTEVPAEYRAPGTWMNDALRVRDDWESRLLRTTSWSPLF